MKYLSVLIIVIFSLSTHADIKTKSLLIFGDSISAGYGMSKEKQWSVLLQEKIKNENLKIKVINLSVSGETTSGGLSRLNQALNSTKPDYLLLELGGNDALRGYPPKKIAANLVEMIKIAESASVKVLLMQIRIPPNYGSRYQKAFESIYLTIASETSATLLPFMLEEVALNKDLMLPDGIHPKASAQPLIADYIYTQLKPLLIH
ncbi:MAG: arylesterase [Gammaproteobacteria bacterium]|nr:MAG: arylesterase [Gammaproteobacteria bacterium]